MGHTKNVINNLVAQSREKREAILAGTEGQPIDRDTVLALLDAERDLYVNALLQIAADVESRK